MGSTAPPWAGTSLSSLDSPVCTSITMFCISSSTQMRRSGKFSAYSLGRARDQQLQQLVGQAAPGAPEEGAGTQTLTQDPAALLTSNRALLKPKVQASTSEAPKHRESVPCCSSPKVSSTGTKSQTQAPKPALPTPKRVCPTQLPPAAFFPSFFFSQVKQKLSLGSEPGVKS